MGRDTIQLEDAVSTISQEYLQEFASEYYIPESLHPELPGPEDNIVDFPEGKIGVYTKFFEFANYRIPISQFLFDILGHFQIHLSQLSVIGAAKVSHFEINCRVLNIRPTVNLFRVFYIPSYNSGWMSFSKRPGKNTPQCYSKPLDSLKNWNNRFFWVDERVFPTVVDWRTSAPKDERPAADSYSAEDVATLNLHRTPIQKQPEELLCLVGLSRNYFLRDDEYPTFLYDDDREMDLFNLINAPNPLKVKTGARPRLSHEVPLLTATATRVINMENTPATSVSSDTPPVIVKSPLDFSNEESLQLLTEGDETETQAQPQWPWKSSKKAAAAEDPDSEKSISFSSMGGPPEDIYQPGWGVTNNCLLDTPEACQDMVDHIVPSGYFSVLRHLPDDDFLGQYNVNLARQVAMGSQLRLRFEQEAKLLKKVVARVARRDQIIQAREVEIKNLEALLEAEADMKKAAEAKNAKLSKELDSLRIQLSDLQFKKYEDDRVTSRCAEINARLDALSIDFDEKLYPHMLTAIAGRRWVIGHGLRLAVMKCAESMELRQVFANVVSAGIANGTSEWLKHGVEHGKAKLDLAAIEAYDPEADDKFIMALQALKDLEYPLVDQLKRLKDAPIDLIMASLHLESDTGEDAPQFIRDLRPSSSQLKIPVYSEVRDPKDPWAFKEEILLEDAIAANISRVEKKKKSRVVCRTHGVGSAHHARFDGVPVSVSTVVPQGLKIMLVDAATQIEVSEDEGSPRLFRSKSLPLMFNLEWS
ncbi:hypothetical protein Tco_1133835 [Tanacetum coccineum]